MRLSLVIPAYNEGPIIAATVRSADSYLSTNFEDYELVIVNDGSTDNTLDELNAIENSRLRIISYERNMGKGYAVRTGMLHADGDLVLFTDADLAYGLEVIGEAVTRIEKEHADIMVGSRKLTGAGYYNYPAIRTLASKCFAAVAQLCSGLIYDTQCGFKCFRRDACEKVFSLCTTDGFAFDFEALMLADRLGFTVTQIPVNIINHMGSHIRLFHDSLVILRDILTVRLSLSNTQKRRKHAVAEGKQPS
jgi:dolichyl-phosphate beta-glucosyltransferase